MSIYNINYDFNVDDTIWVVDGYSIKKCSCVQISIKVYKDSTGSLVNDVEYLIMNLTTQKTFYVSSTNCFSTFSEASAFLEAKF